MKNILIISICLLLLPIDCLSQTMIINKNVVNLRIKPQEPTLSFANRDILYKDNPFQDSQLLLCEKLQKISTNNDWIKVKALEQEKYNKKTNKWDFQTGWIQKKHVVKIKYDYDIVVNQPHAKIFLDQENFITVSIGTKLQLIDQNASKTDYTVKLPNQKLGTIKKNKVYLLSKKIHENKKELRNNIIKTSKMFLNTPYSWGGRSFYDENETEKQTGVDCSAMINLAYRANGLQIPRDSHDQFLKSQHISSNEIKMGDLIFLSNLENKVNHVLLFIGNGKIIHCTGEGPKKGVSIVTDKSLFKKNIFDIKYGQIINNPERGKIKVFFGTYLKNQKRIEDLRLKEIYV